MSIVEFDWPPSWSLVVRETGEYKMVEGTAGGKITPPPVPIRILFSPQFRAYQGTKMVAGLTQRSPSTISRKKIGDSEQVGGRGGKINKEHYAVKRI